MSVFQSTDEQIMLVRRKPPSPSELGKHQRGGLSRTCYIVNLVCSGGCGAVVQQIPRSCERPVARIPPLVFKCLAEWAASCDQGHTSSMSSSWSFESYHGQIDVWWLWPLFRLWTLHSQSITVSCKLFFLIDAGWVTCAEKAIPEAALAHKSAN